MGLLLTKGIDPSLRDPPLWKKDVRRSKQSSTTYVSTFAFFTKGLFFVWRHSIWQAICAEYLIWLACFYVTFTAYRLSNETWQERFDVFFLYCKNFQGLIPLSFILGFYVSTVYGRWWSQWQAIPWIGKMAMIAHDLDARKTKEGLHVRWTFLRYMLLGMGLTFQRISTSFRTLYPDWRSFIDVGIVSEKEVVLLERAESMLELPFVWASGVLHKQTRENSQHMVINAYRTIQTELIAWRTSCAILRGFNNHPIPIALVNIIGFGVYIYFFAGIFSRQFFINADLAPSTTPKFRDGTPADFFFPWFGTVEFIFYVGWFKVSAMMYDPFSAHGCEHVLQRVWDEEISWARQGASYRMWDQDPDLDDTMTTDNTFFRIPYGLKYDSEEHRRGPNDQPKEEMVGGLGEESGTYLSYNVTTRDQGLRSRAGTLHGQFDAEDGLQQPLLRESLTSL